MAKRKTPKKWFMRWWRAVGEFKDGERPMMEVGRIGAKLYVRHQNALRGQCRDWSRPYMAFVYKHRTTPKKIVELQIWPDYSDE